MERVDLMAEQLAQLLLSYRSGDGAALLLAADYLADLNSTITDPMVLLNASDTLRGWRQRKVKHSYSAAEWMQAWGRSRGERFGDVDLLLGQKQVGKVTVLGASACSKVHCDRMVCYAALGLVAPADACAALDGHAGRPAGELIDLDGAPVPGPLDL